MVLAHCLLQPWLLPVLVLFFTLVSHVGRRYSASRCLLAISARPYDQGCCQASGNGGEGSR